jgi:hypothetical protein
MLLEALRQEARRRFLWPPKGGGPDHSLGAAEVFHLVRDMAYGRASSREPLTTIREWRGTCSGKHYLLRVLFVELGLRADLMACTTRITAENSPFWPPELRSLLNDGPIVDIHNYLVLHTPRGPMVVDATWPLQMKTLGLAASEEFVWGQDMTLACEPLVHQMVPGDGDPQAFKESLLRQSADAHELARREAFFAAVSRHGRSQPDP